MTTFERTRPTIEVGDLGTALAFLTDVVVTIPGEGPRIAFGERIER